MDNKAVACHDTVTVANALLPEVACPEPGASPWLWCKKEASAFPAMPGVDVPTKKKRRKLTVKQM